MKKKLLILAVLIFLLVAGGLGTIVYTGVKYATAKYEMKKQAIEGYIGTLSEGLFRTWSGTEMLNHCSPEMVEGAGSKEKIISLAAIYRI